MSHKESDTEDKIILTPEQAKSLLKPGEEVHTLRQAGAMMIGCHWPWHSIMEAIDNPNLLKELGGTQSQLIGHALVIWTDYQNPLFVEADREKVKEMTLGRP